MDILLEAIIAIVGIVAVFSIPLFVIFTSYRLKMARLKQEGIGMDDLEAQELRQQVGQVMAENELLKEAVTDLQRSLGQTPTRIELTEYEKKQIKLDQENKPFY
ncbi:MAG: hypothetical protein ACRBFS_02720 [Aureispira sp.]